MAAHNIIMAGRTNPNCPLCDGKFKKVRQRNRKTKKIEKFLCCFKCEISINKKDPWVGRWSTNAETIQHCPTCQTPMRYFCRSDKYFKLFCPICQIHIESFDDAGG